MPCLQQLANRASVLLDALGFVGDRDDAPRTDLREIEDDSEG